MATRRKRKKKRPAASGASIDAMELLESLYGPVTLGGMLWSLRMCDEISQAELAKTLGVSRSHRCDVEVEAA
ncbi:MAG: hypothetical protein WAU39_18225 [Polyangiales bacterium]